ncbi:S8 family serine peptidase, partial [Cribrihabitans sp. XS_ASV171]
MATIPTDPRFSFQWWLRSTLPGFLDINVIDVWDDYTGDGIQVAIIDEGFDLSHADLDANFRTDIDYDYDGNDTDPDEGGTDRHGTPVAGIIGAEAGNGYGGVGVAWDATLVAYNDGTLGGVTTVTSYRDAAGIGDGLGNTAGNDNGSDVLNGSFGYSSNFANVAFPGYLADVAASLSDIAAFGRGGLGMNFVKSNGNARDTNPATTAGIGMEGTTDVASTMEESISVAALRGDGYVTDYSTPGANLLVSAFGDDNNNNSGVQTTDRTGAPGYNTTDFTNFSGTSAAAPIVSGVVTLMLDANPNLGWRDVQQILAYSARHVGSDVGTAANSGAAVNGGFELATQINGSTWFWNDAENWNGGALHFSNDYGFGLVDAHAAVRMAET